jgi:flagellar basal-body rod protein FlgC
MAGILNAIDLSSRGMSVQRAKMNVVAQNIANAETTETAEGGPYRRKHVVVQEQATEASFKDQLRSARGRLYQTHAGHMGARGISTGRSVEVSSTEFEEVQSPRDSFKLVYDPGHPNADEDGYVKMPDVEVVTEMVDMIAASRGYEANAAAIATAKTMAKNALDI